MEKYVYFLNYEPFVAQIWNNIAVVIQTIYLFSYINC